ncbi:S-adenosyl-L-methionine-dependent methyltransferase [Coniochaeta sp. PMI_546]|nr:S-adenosyl-L-methionine-dependent methyltransferase [Coniochaeta sp. PMI_546]
MSQTKRKWEKGPSQNGGKRRMRKQAKPVVEGSHEEVLLADIQALLAKTRISGEDDVSKVSAADGQTDARPALPERGTEIEVEVVELSSTGDGLARQPGSDRIYTVPFSIPGDTVKVKVYRHLEKEQYSVADFISVVKPSPLRDDSRIQCPYFAKCAGCQFQMLDYPEQLKIKKTIVEKAYKNFSNLPQEFVPSILDTIGSPLQYGYRTKLTPHFDGPPGGTRKVKKPFEVMPPIGFTPKGSKKVLDIEDCPIGTDAVRLGLKRERKRMETEYGNYTRGATILLRENTVRIPASDSTTTPPPESDSVKVVSDAYTDYKTCETDNNATTTEYIDDFIFTNPAGSFFQNNNSILSPFTAYVREHILPPASSAATQKPVKYLIDAYSGSGLFTITLSPSLFPQGGTSIGIDIADKSIAFARRNAELNGLDKERCRFVAADANELFKSVEGYDPDETVVVLDPPRKGCDKGFLRQLLEFRPRRVVYVSCNVHTQARDVGVLVRGEVDGAEEEGEKGTEETEKNVKRKVRYEIESIRGFDFFPQTGHVEGVAVLNRVDE